MKRITELCLSLLLFSSCVVGCDKKKDEELTGGEKKGYATGRVVNSAGKPIQGAKIVVSNTFAYNMTLSGTTNANGEYSIKLQTGTGIGDWIASGSLTTNYNNQNYELGLEPDAYKVFSGAEGGVTNFTLRLTGREPSTSPGVKGSFYGGAICFYPGDGVNMDDVRVTVKAIAPCIDGTTPETVTIKPEFDNYLSWVTNVPLGKYEITVKEGNTPLYIRDYTNGIPASNVLSIRTDFVPCPKVGAHYWIKGDVQRTP